MSEDRRPTPTRGTLLLVALLGIAAGTPGQSLAQIPSPRPDQAPRFEPIFAGSRAEDSLRLLQTLGDAALEPWSVRPFSLRLAARLYGDAPSGGANAPRPFAEWQLLAARFRSYFNSSFPYGYNDGAVWQGRGVTSALDGGIAARAGWVTLTLAPVAYWAQNVPFTLMPNGRTDAARFANGKYPLAVDLPQRFGDGGVTRLDPGQSTLAVESPILTVGLSTANEWWGPMTEFPFVLGDNAPGIPRAFVGTTTPVNLWAVRLHARVIYGRLTQSAYTTIPDSAAVRLGSGFVFTLQPRGVPGLEIGAERFFHTRWTGHLGWAELRKPFESVLKVNLPDAPDGLPPKESPDNQLAGAFVRWVLPRSGFEVYGEYGREDHNWNTRDLLLEPDHATSIGLGFRKAWRRERGVLALRGETINFQPGGIIEQRGEGGFYVHSGSRQGHTNQGQLLGAAVGVASAAGSVLALEYDAQANRTVVTWTRMLRQETGRYWITGVEQPRGVDVSHALGVARTVRLRDLTITAELTGVYELDRDFRSDAANVHGSVTAAWRP